MTKKKISKEELKQVLGGIKSNILSEMESENGTPRAATHLKYSTDLYIKGGVQADGIGRAN